MAASNSRQDPILRLFSRLRNLITAVPVADAPRRPWDSASSREIQLELDFGLPDHAGEKRGPTFVFLKEGKCRFFDESRQTFENQSTSVSKAG